MTAQVPTTTTTTLPTQATPVEPPPAPVAIDHVRAHAVTCYWDFTQCRWQCGR